jgi:hypothetical protein
MAHSMVIEEESGTCRGWVHPHNGYYAGDFSTTPDLVPAGGADAPRHLRAVVNPSAGALTAAALPASRRQAA